MADDSDERQRMVDLLESQHRFPGPFTFRVVVRPVSRAEVVTAMAAVDDCVVASVDERPSRKGTYLSLRVTAQLERAEVALDVYEVLQQLEAVLAVM